MELDIKHPDLLDVRSVEEARILSKADACLEKAPVRITDHPPPHAPGAPNDFYSESDYWWPNPDTPDGFPYIRRDGLRNPRRFMAHQRCLEDMRHTVAVLAAGYGVTRDEKYARKAVRFLKEFFLDDATRMNPNMTHSGTIPGMLSGRCYGIIHAVGLVEVPLAIRALSSSPSLSPDMESGLKRWFTDYLAWLTTDARGIEEMGQRNNHSVAWALQVAVYALFTGNAEQAQARREQYRAVFVPNQMAGDGRFPEELRRTKPYSYSLFELDLMASLCHLLSTPEDDLWAFELGDGRGIRRGMEFLFPYVEDKTRWPYAPDVEDHMYFPQGHPAFLFAGLAFGEHRFLDLWVKLHNQTADLGWPPLPTFSQPLLWVHQR